MVGSVLLADQVPDRDLGDVLQAPAGRTQAVSVASVGEVVVEDDFSGLGRLAEDRRLRDVEPLVCEVRNDFETLPTKGASKALL